MNAPKLFSLAALVLFLGSLAACSNTRVNSEAFQAARIEKIAIVIGGDTRVKVGQIGAQLFPEEILVPLNPGLERVLDGMVSARLAAALNERGYAASHLKTVRKEWSFSDNISDTPGSYESLLDRYAIAAERRDVDAILFVEYLLRPKPQWNGPKPQFSLNEFEANLAGAKIWLYALRTGKRLYYTLNMKGYDQVLSHVGVETALNAVLQLKEFPPVR